MPRSPETNSTNREDKLVLQAIHLELTDAFRAIVREKTERLLRHSDEIVRIRIDIERHTTEDTADRFVAKGQIEIRGPDLIASATAGDAYSALDELIDKFDRLLGRRHEKRKDYRNHPQPVELPAQLPKTP